MTLEELRQLTKEDLNKLTPQQQSDLLAQVFDPAKLEEIRVADFTWYEGEDLKTEKLFMNDNHSLVTLLHAGYEPITLHGLIKNLGFNAAALMDITRDELFLQRVNDFALTVKPGPEKPGLFKTTPENNQEGGSYNPMTNTISIRQNVFQTSPSSPNSQMGAVRILAHELGHAFWLDIENTADPADERALIRSQSEGEALYYEFWALRKIYNNIEAFKKNVLNDDQVKISNTITIKIDEAGNALEMEIHKYAEMVIGPDKAVIPPPTQQQVDALAALNRIIINREYGKGEPITNFTYDENHKLDILTYGDATNLVYDYMEIKGHNIYDYWDRMETYSKLIESRDHMYDIKVLLNQAHKNNKPSIDPSQAATNYFGTDGDDVLWAEKDGPVLGNVIRPIKISEYEAARVEQREVLWGGKGDDTLHGSTTKDLLLGGDDKDTLYGYGGDDILAGNDGNDLLYGGADKNHLYGGRGFDTYYIGQGHDIIEDSDNNGCIKLLVGEKDQPLDKWKQIDLNGGYKLQLVLNVYLGLHSYFPSPSLT